MSADKFYKHPMPFIKLIPRKKLLATGTAVGMWALPVNMMVLSVSEGYGLFQIVHETPDGWYHLAITHKEIFAIKKTKVLVYS